MTEQTSRSPILPILAVIILTKNEEPNLSRCLSSFTSLPTDVFVVDSGSTDRTVEIAREFGATVLHHPWKNYSAQFNWAIEHLETDAQWVARLDADEYMTPELVHELALSLPMLSTECTGLLVKRRGIFLGRWMKHGGMYPIWHLRFWRRGLARCEERWMDEHMELDGGKAERLKHDIVDENAKDLTFWTDKHNQYASRELLDLLAVKASAEGRPKLDPQTAGKRWVKETLYSRSPLFLRAFAYWFFRYVLRFGFLDGKEGLVFHFLQAFWYRFLVDAKIMELRLRERFPSEPLGANQAPDRRSSR